MRTDLLQILSRVLVLLAASVMAAGPAAAQRFLVHSYTEEEGLPASETFDVAQDPSGRIWCATRSGVVAYDGATWELVRGADGLAIRDAQILHVDGRGRTWVFKRSGNVMVGSAERMEGLPGNPLLLGRNTMLLDAAVHESPDRDVVVVTDYDSRIYLWDGDSWSEREDLGALVGSLCAVEAHGDGFLLGGQGGLVALDLDGNPGAVIGLPAGVEPQVRGLLAERVDEGGRVWVQGPDWVGVLGTQGVDLVTSGLSRLDERFDLQVSLASDGRGGLYFGDALSLHHLDGATLEVRRLGRDNGLVAEGARGLLVDEEGLLWIASPLGLSKLVGRHWETYGLAEGLLRAETSALAELPDGRILIGHNGGLTWLDRGRFEALPFEHRLQEGPGRTRVLDLEVDAQGGVWIAASALGLGRLVGGEQPDWLTLPEPEIHWATAVLCDRRGQVWLGTSGGLFRLEDGALRRVDEQGLVGDYVRCLLEAPDGQLLVGSHSGVWTTAGDGRWSLARAEQPGGASGVYALLVDTAGRTWVGARDGLWRLEGGRLVRARVALPSERAVYTLLEDRAGRLWIGTDYGVYRLDGQRLERFTVRSGLSGNETNRAAGLVDRHGVVWLGTERGLSAFRPELEPETGAPVVELVAIEVGGVDHTPGKSLRLQTGPFELVLRARARTLRDERRLGWRWRLDGHEQRWHEQEGLAVLDLRYPRLPAGRYRFQVQARQGDGEWGPEVSTAAITLVAPFWEQPWFRGTAIGLTAVLGAICYRLLSQSRHARALEAEVRRRSEELEASQRELARTERLRSLGVLAGGIAHDFNNVLTALMGSLSLLRLRLDDPAEVAPLLDTADQALERARQLSSQLLTFAKGGEPRTEVVPVHELVEDSIRLVLSGSSVRGEPDLEPALWPLRADPAQIYQALENLLINARQCMPSGGVVRVRARNVELAQEQDGLRPGRYVQIDVADEGPGIEPAVLTHVFEPFFTTKQGGSGLGLATAHSVVERHGGTLTAASRPGAGATFTLLLPAAGEQAPAQEPPDPPSDGPRRRGHVLVMDDEPVVRTLLAQILQTLGRGATTVASGEEALAALAATLERGEGVTCAILDLTVPGGMGGREVLPRLRELLPGLRAIATSGYAEDAILARPQEFGFQGALAKPFRVGDVAAALEAVEARRRPPVG